MPSTSTAAIIMGIMSGFSFIIIGLLTVSGHPPLIWSKLSRISTVTESMFAVCSNSRITMDMLLAEFELMFLMFEVLAMAASMGCVTVSSTCSGLAPGYVVTTIA